MNSSSLVTRLPARGRRRRIMFTVAVLLVFIMQSRCVCRKVWYVDSQTYAAQASELGVAWKWRFGYIRSYHGAWLVRTSNVPLEMTEHEHSELWDDMRHELRLVPLKAGLETGLYLLVLVYAFFGTPWILGRVVPRTYHTFRRTLCIALLWAVGWTILVAPLVLRGYGEPLYSTWVGPGAFSYSGPYLCKPSYGPGLTVSYRGMMEVTCPCFWAMAISSESVVRRLPRMRAGTVLWLLGIWSYGLMGAMFSGVIRPRYYGAPNSKGSWGLSGTE